MMHRLGSVLLVLLAVSVSIQARSLREDKYGATTETKGWSWGDGKAGGEANAAAYPKGTVAGHKAYGNGKDHSRTTGKAKGHAQGYEKDEVWTDGKVNTKDKAWGNSKGFGYVDDKKTVSTSGVGGEAKRNGKVWEDSRTNSKTEDTSSYTGAWGHSRGKGHNTAKGTGLVTEKYSVGTTQAGAAATGGHSSAKGTSNSRDGDQKIDSRSNASGNKHASGTAHGVGIIKPNEEGSAWQATGAWAKDGRGHGSGRTKTKTDHGSTTSGGSSNAKGRHADATSGGKGTVNEDKVTAEGHSDASAKWGHSKGKHDVVSKNNDKDYAGTWDESQVKGRGTAWTKGSAGASDYGTYASSNSGVDGKKGDVHAKQKSRASKDPYY